jgi:hypothetical protein
VRPRLLLAAVILSATAAGVRGQSIEVTPVVGLRFGGGNWNTNAAGRFEPGAGVELDDTPSFGAHIGYRTGDGELELLYARQNSRLQSAELFAGVPLFDLAVETWQLGGSYLFRDEDARAQPFVGLGLGLTRLLPEPDDLSDETRFSFSLGAGVKLWGARHFGLRVEARWFVTVLGTDSGSFCGGGECEVVVATSQVISQADLRAGLILRF